VVELANLKTVHFEEADIAAMTESAARPDLRPEDGFHFHFALGKAHEDDGDAEVAFRHYAEGNRLRRTQIAFDGSALTARVARAKMVLTPEFSRSGRGRAARRPIQSSFSACRAPALL